MFSTGSKGVHSLYNKRPKTKKINKKIKKICLASTYFILCIVGELAGRRSVAVGVGLVDTY